MNSEQISNLDSKLLNTKLLIIECFEKEIRPAIQSDGGDVEFIDFSDNIVYLKLHGACVGCALSSYTLKLGIEERLKQLSPDIYQVISLSN